MSYIVKRTCLAIVIIMMIAPVPISGILPASARATGETEVSSPAAREQPATEAVEVSQPIPREQPALVPSNFKNSDNLKYQLRALKSVMMSISSNYSENDVHAKNFFKNLINVVADCQVTPIESAGISEELAELMVRLKVVAEEESRLFRQFAKVLDEAYIPKTTINKMISRTRDVALILKNKKNEQSDADGLIYKYYGVDGKGHNVFDRGETKYRGKSSFVGENHGNTAELLKKFTAEDGGKKKKIVGIEFMDPNATPDETLKNQAEKDTSKKNSEAKEQAEIDELFENKPGTNKPEDEKAEDKK